MADQMIDASGRAVKHRIRRSYAYNIHNEKAIKQLGRQYDAIAKAGLLRIDTPVLTPDLVSRPAAYNVRRAIARAWKGDPKARKQMLEVNRDIRETRNDIVQLMKRGQIRDGADGANQAFVQALKNNYTPESRDDYIKARAAAISEKAARSGNGRYKNDAGRAPPSKVSEKQIAHRQRFGEAAKEAKEGYKLWMEQMRGR